MMKLELEKHNDVQAAMCGTRICESEDEVATDNSACLQTVPTGKSITTSAELKIRQAIRDGTDTDGQFRSWFQLRPDSPLRPPDWRSRLAREILSHPDERVVGKLRSWADDSVKELIRLSNKPPTGHPIARARRLLAPECLPERVEIEARLLTGSTSPMIATATGLAVEVVEWFARAHFDVQDCLNASGYVRVMCLDDPPNRIDPSCPPYVLAKRYAYFYGPLVLDAVLDVFRHWQTDDRVRPGLTSAELSRRALRLRVRAAVLAQCMPTKDLSPAELRSLFKLVAWTPMR